MSRSRAFGASLILGIGLIAAPAVFQMFDRAPKGGEMIDEFTPYMTAQQMEDFEGYMATIGAADAETAALVPPAETPPPVADLHEAWPLIDDDMGTLIATMRANLDNFDAVASLPPFPLFPWFFVVPGLIAAGLAVAGLRSRKAGPGAAVAVLGVGLILAPVAFQMFTRAPEGGDMLDDLGPYMTDSRVADMQGYFLTLGAAEGAMRNTLLAEAEPGALPATEAFVAEWPQIGNDMAPMVGVMADNLDNFAAVDALPPFPLFPWFFVIPGVLLAGLGLVAVRHRTEALPDRVPSRPTRIEEPV